MSLLSLFVMALRALFFGFFGATLAYFVLRDAFRLRVTWAKVLPAAILANFVFGLSEIAIIGYFDRTSPTFMWEVTGAVAGIALGAGILSSWFIIRRESGRSHSWPVALISGGCVVAPGVILGVLVVSAFTGLTAGE